MSSSSRSIAAARSRRAGESQPPVSGGRPGTSIGSHAAFAPPQPPSNNVRVAKAPIQQQQQQMPQNGLPFSKLSISDAIGLVTLRLGRVEQFVIDFENGELSSNTKSGASIPENSKIVDNSVLTTIINRLDSLEKREGTNASTVASTFASSFASLDQVSKLEKDLKETRELLSHLIYKLELFSKETNDKFCDFEGAISEIEKNMEVHQFVDTNDTLNIVVAEQTPDVVTEGNISLTTVDLKNQTVDLKNQTVDLKNPTVDLKNPTVDLKNLIKQEFSESNL
jgi:hypothetical protein